MKYTSPGAGQFTGKHMLLIMVAFFGVIIAVNIAMATLARTSWTGAVVANSYVASQEFNEKISEARTQVALGWTSKLDIEGGHLRFIVADIRGQPVKVSGGELTLRRPAYDAEDRIVPLKQLADGIIGSDMSLRDGIWIAEVHADAGLGRPYRDVQRIVIRQGSLQ
jgi:nitrogen fixation protein FixH